MHRIWDAYKQDDRSGAAFIGECFPQVAKVRSDMYNDGNELKR